MQQHDKREQIAGKRSRRQAELERLAHLWYFENMDKINRAMQGTNELEKAMKDVLDTLLSVFECDRAWLVYPCDPEAVTWQTPMERTRPEYPSALPIGKEFPLDPAGAAVFRILRDTPGPVTFGPEAEYQVPVEVTQAFNVQSFIAMAIYPKIGEPWSFGLHQCSYARAWNPDEVRLFQEIGRRLSDTLTGLLMYRNLQENDKQVKRLIDSSPVAMVVSSGIDEQVELINDRFIDLFGYTIEDMSDVEHWWPLAYPDERYREEIKTQWKSRVEQAIREKGQIRPMEATVTCKDGSQRFVEFCLSSIGEKHIVTFIDLTERKQAEQALRESEEKFRTLIEQSAEGVMLADEDGNIVEWNHACERMMGLEQSQVLGRPLWDIMMKVIAPERVTAERREAIKSGTLEALRTGKSHLFVAPIEMEFYQLSSKEKHYFHQTIFPIKTEKGHRIASLIEDITERKKSEMQLLASEQLFRALVENSPDFIARYDREYRRIYVNPAIQRLFASSDESVLGTTPIDRSPLYAPQIYVDHLQQAIETAAESILETPFRTAQGEMHWGQMRFVPEFGPDGNVDTVLAIGRDIHEIKENERRFRMLAENFPDFVARFDRNGRHIYVNPAVEKAFGIPAEAFLGKTMHELPLLRNPEQNDALLALIQRVFEEGIPNETEAQWDTEIGERIFELRHIPERDATGNVVSVLSIARDITERKRAEEEIHILNQELEQRVANRTVELAETNDRLKAEIAEHKKTEESLSASEEKFRALVENINDVHFSLDNRGNFTYISPAITRFSHYEVEDVIGQPFVRFVHPDDLPELRARFAQTLSGVIASHEFRVLAKDGAVLYVRTSSRALQEGDQQLGVTGIMTDITKRKYAEEQIKKLNHDLQEHTFALEAANKELEAFAYSVSHDLRAPLRHIDGFIELLQKKTKTPLDEQSRHYMAVIADSAKKMGELIDDLLSFSRMGRREMSKTQVDLGNLVRQVIGELEPEAEGRKINWQIADIPVVMGDQAMLKVVLVNLISNALKFTRTRQEAEIEIGCILDLETEVAIFVRDNGVGFDMDYADKLFGAFQRLHRADEFEGTGIGLANVRRIINRHGGRTWAEGEVDRGATFYFSLPRPGKGE
jgi:PAS domain S-box-containing protein